MIEEFKNCPKCGEPFRKGGTYQSHAKYCDGPTNKPTKENPKTENQDTTELTKIEKSGLLRKINENKEEINQNKDGINKNRNDIEENRDAIQEIKNRTFDTKPNKPDSDSDQSEDFTEALDKVIKNITSPGDYPSNKN